MVRLRGPYILLVVAPALLLAGLGTHIAQRGRAGLGPELGRETARMAVEHLGRFRAHLAERLLSSPDAAVSLAEEIGVRRLTVYGARGEPLRSYPADSLPLPLEPGTPRSEAMLAAARRGNRVADLVRLESRPAWLAYLPTPGQITVVEVEATAEPLLAFRTATGYEVAVYIDIAPGRELAMELGGGWPDTIPAALADSLASLDRALSTHLADRPTAVAPLKDFDDWETIGAVAVRPSDVAPRLSDLPLLPVVGLFLAAAIAMALLLPLATRGFRASEPSSTLRRRFVYSLVVPLVAVGWMAAADFRLSAEATAAALELSARAAALIERPADLPAARLAQRTGAEVVVVRGDSAVSSSGVELSAARLLELEEREGREGRVSLGNGKLGYRVLLSGDDTRLFLFRTPYEDARKGTLFGLAGLYAVLVVGVLIFASLTHAARSNLELREAVAAWSFISPSLILLLVFSAAPLLFALYLSFHGWNLLEPAKPYVGPRHYIELAGDALFWNAAKNTALYSLYVPVTMACALGVAMLLNRSIRGVALLRAVFFLPYVTSFVAISIVWQWMYDPSFGLFNWGLGLVGIGPLPWLSSPVTALIALMIMAVWIHIGFQMVIFLAGLQAIPSELYEAATIDGAGAWRRFWHITLPMLRPTTFFVLVTSIIGSFQVFTFIYVMTEGGPLHATDVIVYHIYQNAWQFLRMGYASAMSWILFAVIFAITLLQFRFLGRKMTPS